MVDDLLEKVSAWAWEELEHSSRMRELAVKIRNPLLRAVFYSIAKDSEKHQLMLEALRDYLEGEARYIPVSDLESIREVLAAHIEEEEKSIEELKGVLEESDDPAVALILGAILEDESRHHELLRRVARLIRSLGELEDEAEAWRILAGSPGDE